MVFHGVGIVAPHPGQDHLLGQDPALALQEKAYDVEFPGGEADAVFPAYQRAGGKVQGGVAHPQLVHLISLTAKQSVDAGQQLP